MDILYKNLEDSKRILCHNSKDSQYNGQKENKKRKIVVNNYFVKGHHLYSGTNKNWHASSCIAGRGDSTYIDSIYVTPTLTIVNKHTVEFCFILV